MKRDPIAAILENVTDFSRILKAARQARRFSEVLRAARLSPDWFRLTGAYLGAAAPAYPFRLRLRGGRNLPLETFADLQTFWRIFLYGEYPVTARDRTIIDAGANCGFFTLYAGMRSPEAQIASIEPFPQTFDRLHKAVQDFGMEARVRLYRSALFGKAEAVRIDDRQEVGSQFRRVGNTGVAVPAVSLAEVIADCGWDRVDLLKMDIEGSEFEALLATDAETISRISRVVMEFHPRYDESRYTSKVLTEYLRRNSFRIVRIRDDGEGYGILHAAR